MNFYKIVFISVFSLFIYSSVVSAEEKSVASAEDIQAVKADLEAKVAASQRETYSPAWEKNFNDMHIRAAALLEENTRLSRENESLKDELAALEQEVETQEAKNKSLREDIDAKKVMASDKPLKKRADIVKQWQKRIDDKDRQLAEYNRRVDLLEKKIALGRLKLKSLDVDGDTDRILEMEEELDRGNAELEENKNQLAQLKEKIDGLVVDDKKLDPSVLNLKEEIDALRVDIADLEKPGQGRSASNAPVMALSAEDRINTLTKKKEDLQSELQDIQERMTKFKNSETMGIANQHTKELVDTISQIDTQNGQWREEIKYLQENIEILKSQVKKLEYQSDAVNSMKGKMAPADYLKTTF